jgi:hypothetical protein
MIKLAARAGLIGPILFAAVLVALTILEYDFMLSLGWRPLEPLDWPSGLALGPYGWVMTLTFLLSGLMMTLFAYGLRLSLPRSRWTSLSTWLLSIAGLGMVGLTFTTDPTIRTTPHTWHGLLHDGFFVVLGLTFMPAMILLGFAFRKDPHWENLATYTWVTVALAVPTFWLKGLAFYVFLLAALIWCEVIAFRLKSVANYMVPPA